MIKWITNGLVVVFTALVGFRVFPEFGLSSNLGVAAGLLFGVLIVAIENLLVKVPVKAMVGSAVGLFVGLFASVLFVVLLDSLLLSGPVLMAMKTLIPIMLVYLAVVVTVRHLSEKEKAKGEQSPCVYKLLDTSVIIDGRISDIADTGFLDGILVIPKFVLVELQHIADSADSLKRNRGRRGLDVLNKLQKDPALNVHISDRDFPGTVEVDSKLVLLAKELSGSIITNDFNLNKVAELQGVKVLNINELSNALKPVVLPGEKMRVNLIKEGKESSQAVAYLEDGTMVVVDSARNMIGKSIEVVVTSAIQTTAGRMIFAKLQDDV